MTDKPKLSPTSRIQHALCCLFVGTPESLMMDPDFSIEKGDRSHWLPNKAEISQNEVQAERLGVDCFRRGLSYRVGVLASIACMVLLIPGYGLLGGWASAKKAYQAHQNTVATCKTLVEAHVNPLPEECR